MMISLNDAIEKEFNNRRNIDPKNICTYGIKCLDDSLKFILPNDLIVIGADTGRGKSELAIHLARHNARNGKRIYLFSLEGGEDEAIRRIKWSDIINKFYEKFPGKYLDFDYTSWVTNSNVPKEILEIELKDIPNDYKSKYGDLIQVYPMHNKFNMEDVYLSLSDFMNDNEEDKKKMFGVNLIIIDHLHYFNLEEDARTSEMSKLTMILKRCKEIADLHHIPVVLISHLRKKDKDRGLPDNEDFHGSSNIAKIASTAITISPGIGINSDSELIYPTFFRVTKSRVGIKPHYAMLTNFNLKIRGYEQDYEVYKLSDKGFVSGEPLPEYQKPKWARKYAY